jgi:hypothetical protein
MLPAPCKKLLLFCDGWLRQGSFAAEQKPHHRVKVPSLNSSKGMDNDVPKALFCWRSLA